MLGKIVDDVEIKPYVELNQIGFIDITIDLIKYNNEKVFDIMKNFIILDVREELKGILIYKCLCKQFRKLEDGEPIPKYKVTYDSVNDICTIKEIEE